MITTTTIIIGAGQCGLTMSQALSGYGVDHVTLDAGRIGQRWRTERWDNLQMLTPNWMNCLEERLPAGAHPDGFMAAKDMATVFERFAHEHSLSVQEETRVLSVRGDGAGYQVQTDQGAMKARNVVIATGACARPKKPSGADDVGLYQVTPQSYKNPSQLPSGGVLVVGASASGLNIARELRASGRDVTVAVGSHMRLPRRYRSADICTWMHLARVFEDQAETVEELERMRRLPSLPLVGNDAHATVDLNALQATGCQIVGRFCGVNDGHAMFSGGLANACASADLKMNRLLDRIDAWIDARGFSDLFEPGHRPSPTSVPRNPPLRMNLKRCGFESVVWATGYTPDFGYLDAPVFDRKGRICHEGGVIGHGLYVLGLPYLRNARSSHVDGARKDATILAKHLMSELERPQAA